MDDVTKKLLKIFKERFDMNLSENWEEIQDYHLMGSKVRLVARDMLYLYFDIEKEFGIRISEENVVNGKFSTLRNIIQIVCCELESDKIVVDKSKVS